MYRFRSIENLLGKYQELEKQEIYFASPEELNDPMEGYRDVFWKGDKIVWKNLLKNYLRCLEHIYILSILLNEDKKITANDIPVFGLKNNLGKLEKEKLYNQICLTFFNNSFIKDLPTSLENRNQPVRRSELLSHLKFIHQFAIDSILEVYSDNQIVPKPSKTKHHEEFSDIMAKVGNLADITNKLEEENKQNINISEILFQLTNMVSSEIELMNKFDYSDKELLSNKFFFFSEFPEHFLSRLESSIYPDWYSASFLYDCSNSAIWGHYGDNHKGICLKFKVNKLDGKSSLNLETEYGYCSGPSVGMRPHTFKEIEYHSKHKEIDFFRSIGRMNKMQLNSLWYSDEDGNKSVCGEHLVSDNEKWRENYWDTFFKSISIKLEEWKYEKEFRLVIDGNFVDYSDKKDRKLKYDFNDLEGIIFGIKTQTSDKIRILKIIEEKCKKNNRKEFDFYQAYYSRNSGKIENQKLNLIKFD